MPGVRGERVRRWSKHEGVAAEGQGDGAEQLGRGDAVGWADGEDEHGGWAGLSERGEGGNAVTLVLLTQTFFLKKFLFVMKDLLDGFFSGRL